MSGCDLCPRHCGADRKNGVGFCGGGSLPRLARAALHHWEEPCISGENGSGAVFFSGCQLKCVFCQNVDISAGNFGKEVSVARLAEIFTELRDAGAHNINLVSATQYAPMVIEALEMAKPGIPVVWNSGGYETVETIEMLRGVVDVYLPDLKYYSGELSKQYSAAPDYFAVATKAISAMQAQVGVPMFDENGLMTRGVIIRHLVLPGCRHDSMKVMNWIADNLRGKILLSLMSQYSPNDTDLPKQLQRKITTFEYQSVCDYAISLGLTEGFFQERTSAEREYTPPFDLTGI